MKKTFADLGIREDILDMITKKGYVHPSPIQEQVIPTFLSTDIDIIGQAQTGTGKTAAFGIPLLSLMKEKADYTEAIILCPTRELAIQVSDEINSLMPNNNISSLLLYGGNPIRNEMRDLKRKPNLIIGTPGRVIDHLSKGRLDLSKVKYFVLDEADEMLNIGFREEMEEIMAEAPDDKRTLLFSATMPREILNIAKNYMNKYEVISVKKENLTNPLISQKFVEVRRDNKFDALTRIIEMEENFYSIVFCRTKMDVDEVAATLSSNGYKAEAIHGDVEQKMREKVLNRFKKKQSNILVATDVAARGIDVNDITHVINFGLPENPETYTHRIGRTGRAGKEGTAITFVTGAERRKIGYFERVIKAKIEKMTLPSTTEVIAAKKRHLVEDIHQLVASGEGKKYMDIAKELVGTEEDLEVVISALVTKFCDKQLNPENYKEIKSFGGWETRGRGGEAGMTRLFIAKGRKDGFRTPARILDFIGTETDIQMSNAGKIDIFDAFSFMDMPDDEAGIILEIFKQKNKRKPLVVEAKGNGVGSSRGGNRGRGGFRWGSRDGGNRRRNTSRVGRSR